MFTGAGRKPPSVPIWIIFGPIDAGSGTPSALLFNMEYGLRAFPVVAFQSAGN